MAITGQRRTESRADGDVQHVTAITRAGAKTHLSHASNIRIVGDETFAPSFSREILGHRQADERFVDIGGSPRDPMLNRRRKPYANHPLPSVMLQHRFQCEGDSRGRCRSWRFNPVSLPTQLTRHRINDR